MKRCICIHGHFYQPPRENPWLEAVELQDSAYPYHDWNERINVECYAANGASRILDGEGRIVQIVNNYSRISFNFGPTLLSWLEKNAPKTYQEILEADRLSRKIFSGHGSALAQAYNHMIMPLANGRDKYTQVFWGIRDFEHRFGQKPEGMWLPETAVDLETLEILAGQGILFTILAPHQARQIHKTGEGKWTDVSGAKIDPTTAYELPLASGKKINLFFYDGPISRAVAFERLLNRGEDLSNRIMSAFSENRRHTQFVHIATDGETYGHHHRNGDMALAYALHYIQSNKLADITIYGEHLSKHPPTHLVEILENTSWSCSHGIERWRASCGCNSGGRPDWNQNWRAPLRDALNWLRDTLIPLYEDKASAFLKDPWNARNHYIDVILNRSPENVGNFLAQHASRALTEEEKISSLKLLELQRHAMLMFTSCGWFFDEISGIETVQILQYAGRAIQLAEELFGDSIEKQFLEKLSFAKSNISYRRDGRQIYERFVRPSIVNLHKVAAHYAMNLLFEGYGEKAKVYSYGVDLDDCKISQSGKAKLAVGKMRVTSEITWENAQLSFGALHFGDHNLSCGISAFQSLDAYKIMAAEAMDVFSRADIPEVIRTFDKYFFKPNYSLKSLFRDEQRKILDRILGSTLTEVEVVYNQLYQNHGPLMRFLLDLAIPLPKALQGMAEFVLNSNLRHAFSDEPLDLEQIQRLMDEARKGKVPIDTAGLGYAFQETANRIVKQFAEKPDDLELAQKLDLVADIISLLPFEVNLWQVQNLFYGMLHEIYPSFRDKANQGDENAILWVKYFTSLGKTLHIHIP
ncbi:MAG TPA: DUF3536 domain-containing protein [Candidatus Omnitrophota bacterium]|nr:DUF3536 domain-containing protein [Candidatus Omnitrophota bacterium]